MKQLLITFAIAIVLFAVQTANAQEEKRIQFAKGKNSATVQGNTGRNGIYYTVRAKSGQKLVVTVTPNRGVGVKIETDGANGHEVLLREERGGTYEVGLEQNGDYSIFLGSINGKPAPYTLTVKIVKMTDI
jgi:opacity protein-like surface antigen